MKIYESKGDEKIAHSTFPDDFVSHSCSTKVADKREILSANLLSLISVVTR